MNLQSKFTKAKDLKQVNFKPVSTTYQLVDELFSFQGGMLEGRVIYLTGVSGAGKTTFTLQLQSAMEHVKSCQYNRESRVDMVKSRNPQFNYHDNLYMVDETDFNSLPDFLDASKEEGFDLLVIDSLRASAYGMEGGKLQREIEALRLAMDWVKETGKNIIFIGMVNRDDDFSGSAEMMHYVDCHLHLQFDKKANERYMYFDYKNRDGEVQKKLYYYFQENGWLGFMNESEWMTQKLDLKMHDVVQVAMQNWIKGWENHPSYTSFKQELSSAQKKIAEQGDFSNQTQFQSIVMVQAQELVDKYFMSI